MKRLATLLALLWAAPALPAVAEIVDSDALGRDTGKAPPPRKAKKRKKRRRKRLAAARSIPGPSVPYCSAAPRPPPPSPPARWTAPPPAPPALVWTMVHACRRPGDIEYRYFRDALRAYQWPGGNQVYRVGTARTHTVQLTCTPGDKICYGARQPSTGLSWALGLSGRGGCRRDCCAVCGRGPKHTRLTCW